MLTPVLLFKALSDETRLRCLALIGLGERCVCDLTDALQLSQPKVSRHLAQFRANGILLDRRQGQWVYYRINPDLPHWALTILHQTLAACAEQPGFAQPRAETSCCG